jgi:hypothetical protein
LSSLPAPEPSAALRRAVAEIPLRHPRRAPGFFGPAPSWFPFRSFARATLLAAAVLALGALAGVYTDDDVVASTPDSPRSGSRTVEEADMIGDLGVSDELGELALLAFADGLDAELDP